MKHPKIKFSFITSLERLNTIPQITRATDGDEYHFVIYLTAVAKKVKGAKMIGKVAHNYLHQ